MAGSVSIALCSTLLCVTLSAGSPTREKRGDWEEQWADFFNSEAAMTQKSPDNSNAPVLKANANNTLVEIICLYSVRNTRKCNVPVQCHDRKKTNCSKIMEGTFTKYDGITQYYQECIFTQWFSNCTHYTNGKYACRKAWQKPSDPAREWGLYAGDVYTGFYAIDEKTGQRKIIPPGERQRPSRNQGPPGSQKARRQRRESFPDEGVELHGTC